MNALLDQVGVRVLDYNPDVPPVSPRLFTGKSNTELLRLFCDHYGIDAVEKALADVKAKRKKLHLVDTGPNLQDLFK